MKEYGLKQVSIRLIEAASLFSDEPVTSPEVAVKVLAREFQQFDRELISVINLQADLRPINTNLVTVGSLSSAMVHPREIFKSAILSNAESIIMIHNHPSGNLTLSEYDRQITERIQKAGELLGIPLLDHIITGKNGEFYSIMEDKKGKIRHQTQSMKSVAEFRKI